jgi:hypothetical protein
LLRAFVLAPPGQIIKTNYIEIKLELHLSGSIHYRPIVHFASSRYMHAGCTEQYYKRNGKYGGHQAEIGQYGLKVWGKQVRVAGYHDQTPRGTKAMLKCKCMMTRKIGQRWNLKKLDI